MKLQSRSNRKEFRETTTVSARPVVAALSFFHSAQQNSQMSSSPIKSFNIEALPRRV
jgi:hypothetical protein